MVANLYMHQMPRERVIVDPSCGLEALTLEARGVGAAYLGTLSALGFETAVERRGLYSRLHIAGLAETALSNLDSALEQVDGLAARAARQDGSHEAARRVVYADMIGTLLEKTLPELQPVSSILTLHANIIRPFAEEYNGDGVEIHPRCKPSWTLTKEEWATADANGCVTDNYERLTQEVDGFWTQRGQVIPLLNAPIEMAEAVA